MALMQTWSMIPLLLFLAVKLSYIKEIGALS